MRLLRPPIPLSVKCAVALSQLGELWPDRVLAENKGKLGLLLPGLIGRLAELLGCEARDLQLDHNPALALREKVTIAGIHVGYRPDANDPAHLIYRTRDAHKVKTLVRGDGAQFSDVALIRREKRRLEKKTAKNNPKYNHASVSRSKARKAKRKYQWPKGRKIQARARP